MKPAAIPITIRKDDEVHNFPSIYQCAKFLKCQTGQLLFRNSLYGWKIELHGERHSLSEITQKIYELDQEGHIVNTYKSTRQACLLTGYGKDRIYNYINKDKMTEFATYLKTEDKL